MEGFTVWRLGVVFFLLAICGCTPKWVCTDNPYECGYETKF